MAARRKRTHGLGSYDREYDYVETRLESLTAARERGREALVRAYDATESGSASRVFMAKRRITDALARLSKEIETAETAERASANQLRRLPRHEPFAKAHRLVSDFEQAIDRARVMRTRLLRASHGDLEEVRAGLHAERDRRRRRR
jgi:hypothetical protein